MKYLGQTSLNRGPDHRRRVAAVELVDGDDAGGRGDVDFGQPLAADHVDADEQQPALPELGRERGANLLFARGELGLRRLAADGEIGADLALTGDAVHRACDLAVD